MLASTAQVILEEALTPELTGGEYKLLHEALLQSLQDGWLVASDCCCTRQA